MFLCVTGYFGLHTDASLLITISILSFALLFYLPVHVGFLSRRMAYYIKGDESRSIIDLQDMSSLGRWLGLLGPAGAGNGAGTVAGGKVDL